MRDGKFFDHYTSNSVAKKGIGTSTFLWDFTTSTEYYYMYIHNIINSVNFKLFETQLKILYR